MIDGNNTTLEWQTHTGRVCVWGIGSFEQHGPHLPLATDVIGAGYFARCLAQKLDAALLPTLPFGNCLEHSGFRGSITLTPETLMQVVRDVADAVERQNFKVLVIVNGHGGNFALVPVIRDINRRDRPLKILHIRPNEFTDRELVKDSVNAGEFHAGEYETSVMLALAPELVRRERVDMPAKTGEFPFVQADLTTFGIANIGPTGVPGFPSKASLAKGRRLVAAIVNNMAPLVRDRIARLEQQTRYAGAGGIALRPMIEADIPEAMRLKRLAGWNQTEDDWRLYLQAAPSGCLAALHNGRVIGTATAVPYGKSVSWIGMVLVDPEFRRLGIATRLMQAAMDSLKGNRCIKLDATPDGRPVYIKLGFQDEYGISRMVVQSASMPPAPKGVKPVSARDWPEIARLDRSVFGADRLVVLRHFAQATPHSAFKLVRRGRLVAFALARPGANFTQIGPVVAESEPDAVAVASAAIRSLSGRPLLLDVPDAQVGFRAWLVEQGFAVQRPFVRMFRGVNNPGKPAQVWALGGPELG